jgi:aconitase A
MRFRQTAAAYVAIFVLVAAETLAAAAQSPPTDAPKAQPNKVEPTSHVTIEVAGGENETPVENASVYIKYVEERKVRKDKKVELNVKTNRDGSAHIPTAPMGRVLIQVVADGWKTYGRWYDISEAKQTFKIHLEKPPRWY